MSTGYVPIPYPTCVYGPDGSVQIVTSPAAAAALPVTYTAAPPFVPMPVVQIVPVLVSQPALVVKSVIPTKKKD